METLKNVTFGVSYQVSVLHLPRLEEGAPRKMGPGVGTIEEYMNRALVEVRL